MQDIIYDMHSVAAVVATSFMHNICSVHWYIPLLAIIIMAITVNCKSHHLAKQSHNAIVVKGS